ncbi:ANTAR domain-containing protein [Kineococcus sp. SYSU DK005]|uniref:ANTAR domain-containing protein n=1 Tax=Kineococcus sp. SYSU DK005 TaxID=3383126 RepID=UPI003D7E6F52
MVVDGPRRAPVPDELAGVLARLSGVLLAELTVEAALGLIASLARTALPGTSAAGAVLVDEHGRRTCAAATDPVAERVEDLQHELREGPGPSALESRRPVRVHDLARETRWPRWTSAVHGLPVRTALCAPMVVAGTCLGVVGAYGGHPGAHDERSERALTALAEQAGVLVANVQSLQTARRLSEQLEQALRTRDTISTAKGIVMAREGLSEESAFAHLVRRSQRSGRKLREVAESVVESVPRRGR